MALAAKQKKKQDPAQKPHIQSRKIPGMQPPEFQSQASTLQAKKENDTHDVPENTGPAQKGKLGVKAENDAHKYDANDIAQGSIGNCYFLAGLAAVAHTHPELIEKAIKDNGNGTYTVTLYSPKKDEIGEADPTKTTNSLFTKLEPRTITVSAEFPTSVAAQDTANYNNLSLIPPHAHGGDMDKNGDTELWVRVIEKAYAVLNGGYAKIGEGGYTEVALEALTGEQYSEKAPLFKSSMKKKLIKAMEKGQPATASTKTQAQIDGLPLEMALFGDSNDVVGGHAYAVLEADEKGVKLRNPWGDNALNPTPYLTWDQFYAFFGQVGVKK